jgi:hypothetical protein
LNVKNKEKVQVDKYNAKSLVGRKIMHRVKTASNPMMNNAKTGADDVVVI